MQRQKPADVLITDIFMPDSDGFELIATVRREYPETKIVVMSGGGQKLKRDYLSSAELIGVDATLQKPFEINDLLEVLKTLLAASHAGELLQYRADRAGVLERVALRHRRVVDRGRGAEQRRRHAEAAWRIRR